MKTNIWTLGILLPISGALACSQPMTTRETGAVIGEVGAAAAGSFIGTLWVIREPVPPSAAGSV